MPNGMGWKWSAGIQFASERFYMVTIECVSYSQFEDEGHFMLRLIDLTELDNVLMVELSQ